jgi:hypothetical protein
MQRRYRHPELREYHQLDIRKGGIGTVVVSDAELAGLVGYLNDGEKSNEGKRVLRIVEEMLAIEKIEPPLWGETKEEMDFSTGSNARAMMLIRRGRSVPHPLLRKISPEKYQRQLDIDERNLRLNRELARNRFLPNVWLGARRRWVVMWQVRSRPPKTLRVNRGSIELSAGGAIQMILDLGRAGYLNRLRRCSFCHKWIYAKFRHQNYCSTQCQQTHYAQSPEWKAKRRDYMRQYRQR